MLPARGSYAEELAASAYVTLFCCTLRRQIALMLFVSLLDEFLNNWKMYLRVQGNFILILLKSLLSKRQFLDIFFIVFFK